MYCVKFVYCMCGLSMRGNQLQSLFDLVKLYFIAIENVNCVCL